MTRFRTVEFLASSPAPTQKELRALESAVGAALPREFKTFLHDANGAMMPYAIYLDTDEVTASLNFEWTFSTGGNDEDSFLFRLAEVRARWAIPREVLPFAREYEHSFVCLDLRPHKYGTVVALLSDGQYTLKGSLADPPFVQVASSFIEYMDRLVPELSDAAFGLDRDEPPET